MAALEPGTAAPDFTLTDLEGRSVRLADALARGPVLLAVYKTNCPTCQLAMPLVEKFHAAYGDGLAVLGISQNQAEATTTFAREKGDTFPQLIDADGFDVSNAYGITNVPTLFLVGPDGLIRRHLVAWDRDAYNALSDEVASLVGKPPVPISTPEDGLPVFKPG